MPVPIALASRPVANRSFSSGATGHTVPAMDVAVIAEPGTGTGRLVRQLARCRGHRVVEEDPEAVVLIPGRKERADDALRALLARVAPGTRVLLVSSFAVGQPEHPFNRFTRGLPAAEA